jgi:hypothetical protein
MENPATTEDSAAASVEDVLPTTMRSAFFKQDYEMYDNNGNLLN